ncbi:MAG: hypothetical protein R3D60_00275 [Paracoccaceae bacterium]
MSIDGYSSARFARHAQRWRTRRSADRRPEPRHHASLGRA